MIVDIEIDLPYEGWNTLASGVPSISDAEEYIDKYKLTAEYIKWGWPIRVVRILGEY